MRAAKYIDPPVPPTEGGPVVHVASTADFLLRAVAAAATGAPTWPYPEEPVPPPSRIIRISQQFMF